MCSSDLVAQLAEFMDVELDMSADILVNNRVEDLQALVYENFSVDWKVISYRSTPQDVYPDAPPKRLPEPAQQAALPQRDTAEIPMLPQQEIPALPQHPASQQENPALPQQGVQLQEMPLRQTNAQSQETRQPQANAQTQQVHAPSQETQPQYTNAAAAAAKELPDMPAELPPLPEVTDLYPQTVSGQEASVQAESAGSDAAEPSAAIPADAEVLLDVVKDTLAGAAADAAYTGPVSGASPEPAVEPAGPVCQISVNGETITMKDKKEYIFVDIFDYILFDLSQSRGRMLVTRVNGEDAQYTQRLHTGDKIEIYWKEN